MATEQTTQKETKTVEKCACTKKIKDIEKEVAELKREIELLRLVIKGGR